MTGMRIELRSAFAPILVVVTLASVNAGSAVAAPDWVGTGGSTTRFPSATHLVGFGVATGPEAMEIAKTQAAADLAKRITVRIEQDTSDVSVERDGVQSYAVAALTRATTDVRLSGVTYETYADGDRTYALAVLDRQAAGDAWRLDRENLIDRFTACLEQAERLGTL